VRPLPCRVSAPAPIRKMVIANAASRRMLPAAVSDRRENQTRRTYLTQAEVDAVKLPPTEGILNKFGMIPLFGAIGAVAVSKEFLIMNDEIIFVLDFALVSTLAYVYGSDSIKSMVTDLYDKEIKTQGEMFDCHVTQSAQEVDKYQKFALRADMYREYKTEYAEALASLVTAKEMTARAALRHKADDEVKQLLAREELVEKGKRKEMLIAMFNYMKDELTSNTNFQREILNNTIKNLSASTPSTEDDPVLLKVVGYLEAKSASL